MENLQTITNRDNESRWLGSLLDLDWSARPWLLFALLGMLGAILAAPVWTVKYPPLVDYPNHLASSFVLAHMHDPRFRFSEFYAPNWQLSPYATMALILVGLQKFLPIQIAGRIVLTLSMVALPPAVWVFLREANPGESKQAFWSLILCNNMYFFLYGFTNMQLSVALCFLTLGFWLRYVRQPRRILWWQVCGLATLLYFTHIVGFGIAGIVVTCYLLVTRRPIRELIVSWLLFLPGIALYLYWKSSDTGRWPMFFPPLLVKLERIPAAIVAYSVPVDFLTMVVVVVCFLWAIIDNPEFRANIPWIVVAACLFAVYMALPSDYGPGGMVARRVLPFVFIVALATVRLGRRGAYLVPVALILFVVRSATVEKRFIQIQPHLDALAQSFEVIPRDSRVLTIVQNKVYAGTPEDSFWAYGVIDRGWFTPYLFHDKGVQPLQIKLKTYTMARYGAFVKPQSPVEWPRIQADYDYIWAYHVSDYAKQMAQIGKVVFSSNGLRVYQIAKPVAERLQKTNSDHIHRQRVRTLESVPAL